MGLLGKFVSTFVDSSQASSNVSEIFPVADCSADECGACEKGYPSSVKIETDTPLWGSAKEWKLHVLVSSGKTDWKHDVSDEPDVAGRVVKAIDHSRGTLEKQLGGSIKLNASSMLPQETSHIDVEKANNAVSTTLLLLPFFVIVHNVTAENVTDLLSEVIKAYTNLTIQDLFKQKPEFFTASGNKGYILLCSHRTRDKRCGITAPIMRKKLEIELRHHNLHRDLGHDEPGGVTVLFVNHVGGHKFAANVFLYLKSGEALWMARVQPQHAQPIVETTILEGKVFPELMRKCFRSETVSW
ncbi:Apd1p [Sugiyamaella lignohabitans]|uniref:Apd1p n=1 Tax=Sugiyamaella lignohabitans TaxID=796027 RepID=A0A167EI33_9ASCO|nr:Apd1p [Sugiyamaella lignohabitans]ANB14112.1 Apd1p [Sugiyamaella lignohabitans]